METITNLPRNIKLYTAALAVAALLIGLMAVTMTIGPAQAQDSANNYADPKPCGPGAGAAFMEEPHEVTTGRFALFDAYWEWRRQDPNVGVMHTNECPPLMVQRTEKQGRDTVTVTTRSASNIDIDEAIIHVLNKHKVDVVETNAEATGGQLSLEEHTEVAKGLPFKKDGSLEDDTQVWWLRLDDPDTDADETSDLSLGFSAALFDSKYWYREDDDGNVLKPMRYMFEVERYPGSEASDVPHFFAYEKSKENNAAAKIVWDSTRVHYPGQVMALDPGEHRDLQWVFTKEGTYLLSVHLQGFVRLKNPHEETDDDYDANWKRISSNDTETAEVKRYTIQVGNTLKETEPPLFELTRSLKENSPAGTSAGKHPVSVRYEADGSNLKFSLDGEGVENFAVTNENGAARVKVAPNAILDFETIPHFDLTLLVSDGLDHEGNAETDPNPHIDHTVGLAISLSDVVEQEGLEVRASNTTPAPGEEVTIRAVLGDVDDIRTGEVSQTWREWDKGTDQWTNLQFPNRTWSFKVKHGAGVTKKYDLDIRVSSPRSGIGFYNGTPVTVTWGSSPSQ